MTIRDAISLGRERLSNAGIERPLLEAELLMSHYIKMDRVSLILYDNRELDSIEGYISLIYRRCESEPIEYITNRAGFYGRDFIVYEGVLIPRPETEILVDKVAEIIKNHNISSIVEVGVGSGVVSTTLALIFPHLQIIATDISDSAIKNAKANIEKFGVEDRVVLKRCSMVDCIDDKIELIVSNPPYISPDVTLDRCVQDYEPHTALFAEDNGYSMLKELIDTAIDREVRFLACEMGYDQKDVMSRYMDSRGVLEYSFYKDYAGLDRGFVARIFK